MPLISLSLLILVMFSWPTAGEGRVNATRVISPVDEAELPPIGFYRGLLPTPARGEDLSVVYSNVSSYTQFVPVRGRPTPFYNMSEDLSGPWGDLFLETLIRGNGMFPLISIDFFEGDGENLTLVAPEGLENAALSDPLWRAEYRRAAKEVLNVSRPMFISVGNEVNRWFEQNGTDEMDPNHFSHFVSLYEEIYDELKAMSPETIVFCTFSREIAAENREANMSVLSLFDPARLDMLVLTTHPYCLPSVTRASHLPDDYYSSVLDHIEPMEFGISEIGWPSLPSFGGEGEQGNLMMNVTGRLTAERGLDLRLLGWSRLTDQEGGDTTGLRKRTGEDKSSLKVWRMNQGPRYNLSGRQIGLKEDFGEHTVDLTSIFYDPDPWDVLDLSVWNGTGWSNSTRSNVELSIEGPSMQLRSIENVSGSRMYLMRAQDWMGWTNETYIQVSIEGVNDPPVLIEDIGPITILEDSQEILDLGNLVRDTDDLLSTLTVEIVESPHLSVYEGYLLLQIMTEERNWWGTSHVLLNISDPGGLFFLLNLTVEVIEVNDPPEVDAPLELTLEEDGIESVNISGWAIDPDGAEVRWNATSLDPLNLSVGLGPDTLIVEPASDWWGISGILMNASDGRDSTLFTIKVHVEGVNDPPSCSDPQPVSMLEDEEYYFDLTTLEPFDVDGDPIYWIVRDFDDLFRSAVIMENDTLRLDPALDRFGTGRVEISLRDMSGSMRDISFDVTILPVNDPPVFHAPDGWNLSMDRGERKSIDLSLFPYTLYDVESPTEDLVILSDCTFITVRGTVVNITVPPDSELGAESCLIWAQDGMGGSSERHTLTVMIGSGGPSGPLLEVTLLDPISTMGRFHLQVRGAPSQVIWVVIDDGTSIRMEEISPGLYEVVIEDPGWSDGRVLRYHLSNTDGGPNDTDMNPAKFTYKAPVEEGGDPDIPGGIVLMFGLVLLSVVLIVFAFLKRNREDAIPMEATGEE